MNKKIIAALYKKEMTDILRDKKTILMMIVVPLILYPLIFIGSMALSASIMNASTSSTYRIGFDQVPEAPELREFFSEAAKEYGYDFLYLTPNGLQEEGNGAVVTVIHEDGENTEYATYEEALKNGYLDAYLTKETADAADGNQSGEVYRINYLASETDSQTAASMIEDMLEEYRQSLREERLIEAGLLPDDILYPISYEYQDMSSNEETMGSLLGYIIPFLMITSILMGAMYPAIDTTAGEKERGTLETLLTLPVRNLEMIMSKFLATSTVAVAAALLNLISMGILGAYMYESMQAASDVPMEFNVISYLPAIFIMILCVAVFALFASAVCLCVCIFARSFKEAQNYTTPVMLVFMFAGMAGMIPAVSLDGSTSLIPVVNVALLIVELFKFHFDMGLIAMVLFSNVAYSLLAVVIMTKLFNSEDILFGDGTGSIRLLEKRSDMKEKQIPGIGDVVLLLSILLIVLMLIGSIAIIKYRAYGLVIQQLMILGITVFYCWYIKTDFKKVFHLKRPKIGDLLTGTLLWVGTYILMMTLTVLFSAVFPGSAESAGQDLLNIWENAPIWLVILSSALLPAICEETAFRGVLFGTLQNKCHILVAVLITGVVFGLYHMNLIKFFVVGFFGCVLAYAVYKTGSIAVSMWMHFLNNLFSVLLTFYEDQMASIFPILFREDPGIGELAIFVMVGVILFVVSILLLRRKRFNALK
ncbi:MAG: ABC transporter permease subunit [Lachnospiraceae bacterium]|nr:ABC transporter permease subunit [Lachnospiraceae bacterium]